MRCLLTRVALVLPGLALAAAVVDDEERGGVGAIDAEAHREATVAAQIADGAFGGGPLVER